MKKILLVLGLAFGTFAMQGQVEQAPSEEYAIVDVIERGYQKSIRISIGEEEATERVWKTESTNRIGDFSPVIKVLNDLNRQGFELLTMSTSHITIDGYGVMSDGDPRFTFMMVRKIKRE